MRFMVSNLELINGVNWEREVRWVLVEGMAGGTGPPACSSSSSSSTCYSSSGSISVLFGEEGERCEGRRNVAQVSEVKASGRDVVDDDADSVPDAPQACESTSCESESGRPTFEATTRKPPPEDFVVRVPAEAWNEMGQILSLRI